jgi:hypothetical protein
MGPSSLLEDADSYFLGGRGREKVYGRVLRRYGA